MIFYWKSKVNPTTTELIGDLGFERWLTGQHRPLETWFTTTPGIIVDRTGNWIISEYWQRTLKQ